MGPWVMIFGVWTGSLQSTISVTVTPIYFQTEDACRTAALKMISRGSPFDIKILPQFSAVCVSTATGEQSSSPFVFAALAAGREKINPPQNEDKIWLVQHKRAAALVKKV